MGEEIFIFVPFNSGQYILFYNVLCSDSIIFFKNHWRLDLTGVWIGWVLTCLLCGWLKAVAKLVFWFLEKVKSWVWPTWTASCFWLCFALFPDPHTFLWYLLKFRYFSNPQFVNLMCDIFRFYSFNCILVIRKLKYCGLIFKSHWILESWSFLQTALIVENKCILWEPTYFKHKRLFGYQ